MRNINEAKLQQPVLSIIICDYMYLCPKLFVVILSVINISRLHSFKIKTQLSRLSETKVLRTQRIKKALKCLQQHPLESDRPYNKVIVNKELNDKAKLLSKLGYLLCQQSINVLLNNVWACFLEPRTNLVLKRYPY